MMEVSTIEVKLAKYAASSRIVIIVLQILFNYLLPDHDAKDVFLPPLSSSLVLPLDRVFGTVLDGFYRWDGVHFIHIAENGYVFENNLPFLPLYPLLVRGLAGAVGVPLAGLVSAHYVLLLSALLVNVAVFAVATVALYRLTVALSADASLAVTTALLFIINPATIFMSAPYSEPLFALLVFSGMTLFERGKTLLASLVFGLATVTRANGLLLIGFPLFARLKMLVSSSMNVTADKKNISWINSIALAAISVITLAPAVLDVALTAAPFLLYQYYVFQRFCEPPGAVTVPARLITYGQSHNYSVVGHFHPSWCDERLPVSYSAVQAKYWNLGLLAYAQLKQLPNFLLAAPMILLCVRAALCFYRRRRELCRHLGLWHRDDVPHFGFSSDHVFPYVCYCLVLVVAGLLFMHVQILTRLISASCPVVYWYLAADIIQNFNRTPRKSKAKPRVSSASLSSQESCTAISYLFQHLDLRRFLSYLWSTFSVEMRLCVVYFVGYALVGTCLFVNFLPWT